MSTRLIKRLRQFARGYRYRWLNRNFKPYTKTVELAADAFQFRFADITAEQWYCEAQRPFQEYEMRFIKERVLRPGDRVIECGPHHGLYTVGMARHVGPQGRIVAIEASPANARVCAENAQLNGLTNVTVVNAAVGNQAGYAATTADSNVEIVKVAAAGARPHKADAVEIVALDRYIDLKPAFIKIDIEGFELEALRGGATLLTQQRPALEIEVHTDLLPNYDASIAQILAFAPQEHYQLFVQWDDREAPVPWTGQAIDRRIHLFALPKP